MITFEFQESSTDIKIKAIAFDEAVKPLDREISLATNYAFQKQKSKALLERKSSVIIIVHFSYTNTQR